MLILLSETQIESNGNIWVLVNNNILIKFDIKKYGIILFFRLLNV